MQRHVKVGMHIYGNRRKTSIILFCKDETEWSDNIDDMIPAAPDEYWQENKLVHYHCQMLNMTLLTKSKHLRKLIASPGMVATKINA